jgi:hypothetical protein
VDGIQASIERVRRPVSIDAAPWEHAWGMGGGDAPAGGVFWRAAQARTHKKPKASMGSSVGGGGASLGMLLV